MLLSEFVDEVVVLKSFHYESMTAMPMPYGASGGVIHCSLLSVVGIHAGEQHEVMIANRQPVSVIRELMMKHDIDHPLICRVRQEDYPGGFAIRLRPVDDALREAANRALKFNPQGGGGDDAYTE